MKTETTTQIKSPAKQKATMKGTQPTSPEQTSSSSPKTQAGGSSVKRDSPRQSLPS